MRDAEENLMRTLRIAVACVLVGLAACSGGSGTTGGTTGPLQQQGLLSGASGLEITASIAAVTLGDECGGGGQAPASDFAGKCAVSTGCGSICQASNLQLVFKS